MLCLWLALVLLPVFLLAGFSFRLLLLLPYSNGMTYLPCLLLRVRVELLLTKLTTECGLNPLPSSGYWLPSLHPPLLSAHRLATLAYAVIFTSTALWLAHRRNTGACERTTSVPTHRRTRAAGCVPWTRRHRCKTRLMRSSGDRPHNHNTNAPHVPRHMHSHVHTRAGL